MSFKVGDLSRTVSESLGDFLRKWGIPAIPRPRKHCGNRENAGYQHFLLFPTMFSKGPFHRVVKSRDCVGKSYY